MNVGLELVGEDLGMCGGFGNWGFGGEAFGTLGMDGTNGFFLGSLVVGGCLS